MVDYGLQGKVVVVTGANHGIGAATARAFAAEGASVFIHYWRLPLNPGETEAAGAAVERGEPGMPLYRARQAQSGEAVAQAIREQVRRLEQVADVEVTATKAAVPTASYRWLGLAGFGTFVALMAVAAPPLKGEVRAVEVDFTDVSTGAASCTSYEEQCLATTTIRFTGEDPVPDATWFYALSWQGQPREEIEPNAEIPTDPTAGVPGLVRSRMLPTGTPGEYRSEHPLPLYGQWKSLIRIHERTNDMMSWALYMPDDPAIESARGREIRVLDGDTIESRYEPKMLQRERKDSVPESVYAAGNYLVISLWVAVLLGFGACYNRAAGAVREKVAA